MQPTQKNRGFTLAEMAIVVVIAGILLVAGVKILSSQMDNASYHASKSKQETIKQALITYLGRFQRLPCPDTRSGNGPGALSFTTATPPDGIENRATAGNVTSNCAASFGVLPYAELGLARDLAMDGWGNLFSYHLSTAVNNWALTARFSDTNSGALTISDRNNAGVTFTLTNTAVAILISHGKNGSGSFTIKGTRAALPSAASPDERENIDADTSYFKREYTDNTAATGGTFDDLLMYIMADDLIAPLRREGTIKNMEVTTAEQLDNISRAVIGFMMGAGCNTPTNIAGLGLASINDPWGTAIIYTTNYDAPNLLTASDANLSPAGAAATEAFNLNSYGPDRAVAGGDDVSLSMSIGQLRGFLGIAYAARCP